MLKQSFVIFGTNILHEKCARKMLMKLPTALDIDTECESENCRLYFVTRNLPYWKNVTFLRLNFFLLFLESKEKKKCKYFIFKASTLEEYDSMKIVNTSL